MHYKKVIISEFGKPEVLKYIEEPLLPKPKSDEVRIRVLATSAAFTDTMIRKGKYPEVKEKPPFSPGYDMVGIVDSLGESVTSLQVGQKVADLTVIGAYSEYICLPANKLTLVPKDLDPVEVVSLVLSYVTAYQMLHRIAKVQAGQSILIHGAGGAVGTAMLQLGVLLGLEMFGTASKAKHNLVSEFGATPINYKSENWAERILDQRPDGIDAVFDAIGGDSFKQSFRVLRKGGTLVGFGFYNAVMGKGGNFVLDFLRLKLWNFLPNGKATAFYIITSLRKAHPDWFSEDLTVLFNLLLQGKIKPIIAKRLPLSDAKLAHELIEAADVQGKIVLTMNEAV